MVSADRVPLWLAGYYALDSCRVSPTPGLTGSPSRLVVLARLDRLGSSRAINSSSRRLCLWLAVVVSLSPGHDHPGDACGLVGHGGSDQLGRLFA